MLKASPAANARPARGGSGGIREALQRLRRDQRGGVAIIAGVSAIPLMVALGIGVEVTHWTVVKTELQRTADLAALAGVTEYRTNGDNRRTVDAAANIAELNGASGGTARTWDPVAKLLTDNLIVVEITAGPRKLTNTAVKVTVRQSVPLVVSGLLGSTAPVVISAVGWAETTTPVEACFLAIDPASSGINGQGSVGVTLNGCSMRSNAAIATGGSAQFSAAGFYAAGSISGSETGGPIVPNDGVVADPYATYAPVQTAMKRAMPTGTSNQINDQPGGTTPVTAGTSWTSWNIKGTVNLAPGIYYVYGNISLGAQAVLTGTGVTIVTSGTVSMNGGSNVTLSAALKVGAVNGVIPGTGAVAGVVFIGSSTGQSSFLGNTAPQLTGAVYNPNGILNFGGTAQGGSAGCLQVVAKSITLSGNSSVASKCTIYGTLPILSEPFKSVLVQ